MPAAVVEKPKAPQPPPPAPQAQPPARPKPVAQPVQTAPVTPKPKAEPKPEPKSKAVRVETKPQTRPHEPQKTAETKMFKDIYEVEKKKSPVPFIAVGAGLVIVAAVGFFILRPKHAANPAGPASNPPTTLTQSSVPEKTQDTSVPSLSEEKLRAVSPKPKAVAPQNQNRQAELLPTAEEAIVPPQTMDISRMTVQKPTEKKQDAKTAEQKPVELKPTDTKTQENKTEEAKTAETQASQAQGQPPVKTETSPPQGSTANTDNAGAPPAPVVWAKTGDLVDLAAVDEPPKILKTFEPAYPLHAKQFGKEGQITVNALINEAGNVIETGILKGLKDDMGLEKAAADAVRKWKFQPAKKDGVNVKVWRPVIITFKAGGTKIP
jgi:protein TonB